jgi:hypothetical protein
LSTLIHGAILTAIMFGLLGLTAFGAMGGM